MWHRILRDTWPYRWYAAGTLACTIVYSAGRIVPPLLARTLLDRTLHGRGAHLLGVALAPGAALVVIPGIILLVAVLLGLSQFLMRFWGTMLGQHLASALQVRVLRHLLGLPTPALERRALGRQMVRFAGDMSAVRNVVGRTIPEAVRDALGIGAVLASLIALHPGLALPIVLAVAGFLAVLFFLWPHLNTAGGRLRSQRARIAGIAFDRIAAARTVKAFGREAAEVKAFAAVQPRVIRATGRLARLSGAVQGGGDLAVGLSVALGLGWGAREVMGGGMSRGELVAFYGLTLLLFSPLRSSSRTIRSLALGQVAYRRLYGLLDRPLEGPARSLPLEIPEGRLAFAEVQLDGVAVPDLRIGPGVIALVDRSGRVNAALVELFEAAARPTQGTIALDDVDLSTVRPGEVRRGIAVIPSAPGLVKGSLRRNLRSGRETRLRRQMIWALRAVGAGWADREALGAPVGSGGRRLAPRRRWQVHCARVVLAGTPVAVLDNPPVDEAALDRVLSAFREAGVRTTVVLLERSPSSPNIDQVIVLDEQPAAARA